MYIASNTIPFVQLHCHVYLSRSQSLLLISLPYTTQAFVLAPLHVVTWAWIILLRQSTKTEQPPRLVFKNILYPPLFTLPRCSRALYHPYSFTVGAFRFRSIRRGGVIVPPIPTDVVFVAASALRVPVKRRRGEVHCMLRTRSRAL